MYITLWYLAGFWWAIITMTTVGYGDFVPETIQGRIVGGITASFGVALVAIPAGIFISGCFLWRFCALQIVRAIVKNFWVYLVLPCKYIILN